MLENIQVLYHSSIRIDKGVKIYIDPFRIQNDYNDADIIFITHDHYDHFSEKDIQKVMKKDSIIVVPKDIEENVQELGFVRENIIEVMPNDKGKIKNIEFETIHAYNTNKVFHPKENNWVGYILNIDGIKYYIAGDTDITEENRKVKCDVAFVPVGGTYTMTWEEAAILVNEIKPKIAVPIHYGSIVGITQDAVNFTNMLNLEIEGKILMK